MKKTLSLLLALCMVVALVAMPVAAEATQTAKVATMFNIDAFETGTVLTSELLADNNILKYAGVGANADVTYTKADGSAGTLLNYNPLNFDASVSANESGSSQVVVAEIDDDKVLTVKSNTAEPAGIAFAPLAEGALADGKTAKVSFDFKQPTSGFVGRVALGLAIDNGNGLTYLDANAPADTTYESYVSTSSWGTRFKDNAEYGFISLTFNEHNVPSPAVIYSRTNSSGQSTGGGNGWSMVQANDENNTKYPHTAADRVRAMGNWFTVDYAMTLKSNGIWVRIYSNHADATSKQFTEYLYPMTPDELASFDGKLCVVLTGQTPYGAYQNDGMGEFYVRNICQYIDVEVPANTYSQVAISENSFENFALGTRPQTATIFAGAGASTSETIGRTCISPYADSKLTAERNTVVALNPAKDKGNESGKVLKVFNKYTGSNDNVWLGFHTNAFTVANLQSENGVTIQYDYYKTGNFNNGRFVLTGANADGSETVIIAQDTPTNYRLVAHVIGAELAPQTTAGIQRYTPFDSTKAWIRNYANYKMDENGYVTFTVWHENLATGEVKAAQSWEYGVKMDMSKIYTFSCGFNYPTSADADGNAAYYFDNIKVTVDAMDNGDYKVYCAEDPNSVYATAEEFYAELPFAAVDTGALIKGITVTDSSDSEVAVEVSTELVDGVQVVTLVPVDGLAEEEVYTVSMGDAQDINGNTYDDIKFVAISEGKSYDPENPAEITVDFGTDDLTNVPYGAEGTIAMADGVYGDYPTSYYSVTSSDENVIEISDLDGAVYTATVKGAGTACITVKNLVAPAEAEVVYEVTSLGISTTYDVTFIDGENETVVSVGEGWAANAPEPDVPVNAAFVGWGTDEAGTEMADLSSITEDMTVYAIYNEPINLTYVAANEYGTVDSTPVEIAKGGNPILPELTRNEAVCPAYYTVDGNRYTEEDFLALTFEEDTEVSVMFKMDRVYNYEFDFTSMTEEEFALTPFASGTFWKLDEGVGLNLIYEEGVETVPVVPLFSDEEDTAYVYEYDYIQGEGEGTEIHGGFDASIYASDGSRIDQFYHTYDPIYASEGENAVRPFGNIKAGADNNTVHTMTLVMDRAKNASVIMLDGQVGVNASDSQTLTNAKAPYKFSMTIAAHKAYGKFILTRVSFMSYESLDVPTVTVAAGDNVASVKMGGASVTSRKVPEGAKIPLSATVNAGNKFAGWTAETGTFADETAASTYYTAGAEDVTVTATAEAEEYEIIFDAGENGTITSGEAKQYLKYGETPVEPTVESNVGYTFIGWNAEIATVTGDATYTAVYEAIEYTIKGSGTEDDPYLINNLKDLQWFRDDVNNGNNYKGKYVLVTDDIDLSSEENWTPIGNMNIDKITFLGTFDGGEHTISNLTSHGTGNGYAFFGRTGSFIEGETAVIKNITFNNVDVRAEINNHWTTGHGDYIGGVIANSSANTYISNVHVTGNVYVAGCGYVGAIVAHGYPKMDNCSVVAEEDSYVNAGYWCAGGLIGYAGEGGTKVTNSYVEGLDIWSAYGAAAAAVGLAQTGIVMDTVSAKNVDVSSNSDYCMGYIAGNGEEGTLTGITVENVTVSAQGSDITSTDAVAKVGNNIFFDLGSAVAAAEAGDTVTLIRNAKGDVTVAEGQNITIDLAGYDIVGEINGIINNGTLTMEDSVGNGKVYTTDISAQKRHTLINYGTITINGGWYGDSDNDMTNKNTVNRGTALGNYGTAEINGGYFTCITAHYPTDDSYAYAIITVAGSTTTINNATVYGDTNGTIYAGGDVVVNDGKFSLGFEGQEQNIWYLAYGEGNVEIKGGEWNRLFVIPAWGTDQNLSFTSNVEITGGTFNFDSSDYCAEGLMAVKGDDGRYTIVEIPELPTATITTVPSEEIDVPLTFSQKFIADEITEEQLAFYGDWYADFVITFNKDVTFNADGSADGYLAGQYDDYSENWVAVPFGQSVTLKAGESLNIMEYALEITNYNTRFTYRDVYEFVKEFDCGVFFSPEFLAANPDIEVGLELAMFEPAEEGEEEVKYTVAEMPTYEHFVAEVAGVQYKTLSEAVEAAEEGATVTLLDNNYGAGVVVNKDITIDLAGYTYTFTEGVGSTGTESNGFQLLAGNTVEIKNGTLEVAESAKEKFYTVIQNYANLTLTDVTLDGTNLDKWSTTDGDSYVLSNNSGNVELNGETNIIANDEGDKAFAFDVCKYGSYEAPVVTVNTTGTISGKIEVTEEIADNLDIYSGTYTENVVDYCADGFTVKQNADGTYGIVEMPELPTATVTTVPAEEIDVPLTFSQKFIADEITEEQLAFYGDWYADFVITFNKDVTFNADGSADGYLAGQYDDWSENWVCVPFGQSVSLKAGESLNIMEYALEITNYNTRFTYRDVYEFVKEFDCGAFFSPEFLAANPDIEVELALVMFNPVNDDDAYVIEEMPTYEHFVAEVAGTQYKTLAEAVEAAAEGATVTLLGDNYGAGVVIDKDITIDLAGYTYTFTEGVGSTGTESNGFQILKDNTVEIKNGTLEVAESAKDKFYTVIQNYANLTLTDVTLDGTNLDKWSTTDGDSYTLSNNSGNIELNGETNIIANDEGDKAFAFDVCKYGSYAAPVVNVNTTGTISGKIEVTEEIADNLTIYSGKYTEDVSEYCIEGWEASDEDEDGIYEITEKVVYTVTFDAGEHGTIPEGTETVTGYYGDAVEAPEVTVEIGYTFLGWDAEVTEITGNVTYTAQYERTLYTVTFDPAAGGTIAEAYQKVQGYYGDEIPFIPNIKLNPGYTFVSWSPAVDFTITGDVTYTAQYESIEYTITFDAGEHGTIPAGKETTTANYGEIVTPPVVTPENGWEFIGWTPEIKAVEGNATYTAQYAEGDYTVTFVIGEHGTTEDQTVFTGKYGTEITVPEVTANAGYVFKGWDNLVSKEITGNATYTAQYAAEAEATYTVMFVSGELGYFTATENRDAQRITGPIGTAVTAPAVHPLYGYTFTGWDKEVSATIEGNEVYRAQYEKTESEIPFKDIVTLRAEDVVYRPSAKTINIYMDRALVRQASGSLGVAIVPNEGETVTYAYNTEASSTDGTTTGFTQTNTSKYTSFVSGVNTEKTGGGEHGNVSMKIFKKTNGTRMVTDVTITDEAGNATVYTINIVYNDNTYEGDVNITEVLPLRASKDSFVIDNEAKTIYYETTSNYTSAGFAVATDTGFAKMSQRPRRQLTAKSGYGLAHGEIAAGGAQADKFDRYVVARASWGMEQTYVVKVHGGEDGLEYSWYTVTVKFNRLFEGDVEFVEMLTLNADSYEFIDETNTINITYSGDSVAVAPVLIQGVKTYYKMVDENNALINNINDITPTTIDGVAGYAFRAYNGDNQTFVIRLEVNDAEYTDYTINLTHVG